MVKLDAGNVLLKPSHRRQLMSWLRRPQRLGNKLGDFAMTVTLAKIGRSFDARASIQAADDHFACHSRHHDWRTTARTLVRSIANRLHDRGLRGRGAVA